MRRVLAAAAAAALLAAGARAQTAPTALVWLPSPDFQQWSVFDALLRARPELRLTVALTPEMATPLAKDVLGAWAAAGRVEIAARIPGDPILPYVDAHPGSPRPSDALDRCAAARREIARRMGSEPTGLVPGDGALDPSLIQPLGACGAPWILAGPYVVAGSSWASAGSAVFVPAGVAGRDVLLGPAALTAPGATAVDESSLPSSDDAPSPFLTELSSLPPGTRPDGGWDTVSQLLAAAGPASAAASAVSSWPAWNGAVVGAPADPAAREAWEAYGAASLALRGYENSGAASLGVLGAATNLLRRAQDARFYRAPPPGAAPGAGLDPELRTRLLAVYKRIRAPAPDSLYASGGAA
ncbi:MAG: hypothetical protein KGM24_03385, partial [Elusimicrobia bacterium]|nr:hypothetical protein [Elusimicrobiota bacterium]